MRARATNDYITGHQITMLFTFFAILLIAKRRIFIYTKGGVVFFFPLVNSSTLYKNALARRETLISNNFL